MKPGRGPKVVHRKSDEVRREPVAAGTDAEMQVLLGPAEGVPNFSMRRFTMGPGGGMPRHTNTVEHEQYVVSGRARVVVNDKAYDVAQGDVLYIPAGAPHSYTVLEAPFQFLCMVPNERDKLEIR
jgi:quercetin dioxygenase-like cupin family protein